LAVQHIREAAIRTCENTLLWRHAQPTYNLLPGVHEYSYNKPSDTDVHVVFGASVNGYPLIPMTLEQALSAYPSWADMYSGIDPASIWSSVPSAGFNESEYNGTAFNGSGPISLPDAAFADASEPRAFTQLTSDKYIVLPLPDNERVYTIRMFYALKPKRTSVGMESAVLDELEEVIMHSALQHLLVMPNVTWTNLELASYHAKQSLRSTMERRARANLGNMRGTLVASAPKFA
jgi:hypothetical protein